MTDHLHSLFKNIDYGPREFRTRAKAWRGIPIDSSPPMRPQSSLAHWDMRFSELEGSPEALFGSAVGALSSERPPWYSNQSATLKKSYSKSGYGPSVIAALYTMGYSIHGLPDHPIEGTVVKFQEKSGASVGFDFGKLFNIAFVVIMVILVLLCLLSAVIN
jgi:hypothetical protein